MADLEQKLGQLTSQPAPATATAISENSAADPSACSVTDLRQSLIGQMTHFGSVQGHPDHSYSMALEYEYRCNGIDIIDAYLLDENVANEGDE